MRAANSGFGSTNKREKLPPVSSELRKEAQRYSAECVERLAFWVRSRDAKVSLKAAELLLAYGHGPVTPAEELEAEPSPVTNLVKPGMTAQEAAEAYMQMLRRPRDLGAKELEKLPPDLSELRKQARKHAVECVARLAFWVRSRDAKVSLRAAELLLALAHCPVTPTAEIEAPIASDMTPQQCAELYMQMLRETGMDRTG